MKKIEYTAEEAHNDAMSFLHSLEHTIELLEELIRNSASKGHISCDATSYVPKDQRHEIIKQLESLGYIVQINSGCQFDKDKFFIFW